MIFTKLITLEEDYPDLYLQLLTIKENLENHFKDACDIEFTIENGELYILGVRRLNRSPKANLRFAIDFFLGGIIDLNESIQRIHIDDLIEYVKPIILTKKKLTFLSRGIPAFAGAVSGAVCFDNKSALNFIQSNIPYILVKHEIAPEDLSLIDRAEGVLTFRGGMTSHAALVCRGFSKPCIVGCSDFTIESNHMKNDKSMITIGEFITIDGTNGTVYKGKAKVCRTDWRKVKELISLSRMIETLISSATITAANIGKSWIMRDFFLHDIPFPTSLYYDSGKRPDVQVQEYISFVQPNDEIIASYWKKTDHLAPSEKSNYQFMIKGIRSTLLRSLSNSVGIRNHYKYFRPLFDPSLAVKESSDQLLHDEKSYRQLIGEEYFNVNRYVPHLIDIHNIKLFIEIEANERDGLWFLDFTNIKGESLVETSFNVVGYKIFINDAEVAHDTFPFFYNSFRRREYFWTWYEFNKTNHQEITTFLKKSKEVRLRNYRLYTYAHELNLLHDNDLTQTGLSLIGEE